MDNFLNPPDADEHRRNLQYAAMPHLARAVVESGDNAEKIGERVREAIDGLLGIRREAGAPGIPVHGTPEADAAIAASIAEPSPSVPHAVAMAEADAALEAEIQAKGLTAPRVTLADLQANIVHKRIVVCVSPSGQVLRWAVLTTRNGFAVTGRPSVSVSPENDNAEIGEKVAIDNAMQELWPLMGYALKERLAAPPSIQLTPAEVQSGLDRVRWAEGLIKQLPEDHDGRNSWLLNYGSDKAERQAEWARRNPQSSLANNIAAAPDLRPASSDDDF